MSRPQLGPGDEMVRMLAVDSKTVGEHWRVTHVEPQAQFPTEEHVWVRLVYVPRPEEKP